MGRGRGKRTTVYRLEEIERHKEQELREARVRRIGKQGEMIDARLDAKGHRLARSRRG